MPKPHFSCTKTTYWLACLHLCSNLFAIGSHHIDETSLPIHRKHRCEILSPRILDVLGCQARNTHLQRKSNIFSYSKRNALKNLKKRGQFKEYLKITEFFYVWFLISEIPQTNFKMIQIFLPRFSKFLHYKFY